MRAVRSMSWGKNLGPAILDEAQKEPIVFEKVKYSFDAGDIDFTVLLGSSQILLLKRIRETLAGRAFFYELFPLMLSEIAAGKPAQPPLVSQLITATDLNALLQAQPAILLPQEEEPALAALEYMLTWGGMPALLALDDADRRQWLQAYGHTYLERDLADLARLDDLSPFREFQRLAALRSGQILSYSELSRDAGIATSTSRRYLQYLKVSYQTFVLPPYHRNLTSTVIKTPKIFWIDLGIMRHLQGYWSAPTGSDALSGALFDTFVSIVAIRFNRILQRRLHRFRFQARHRCFTQKSHANAMFVLKMTMRSFASSASRLRKRMRSRGSSSAAGSPTTMICGPAQRGKSVCAMPTRCFMSPEKVLLSSSRLFLFYK